MLMKKRMRQLSHRMPIIPPTQLVVGSYSAYETQSRRRLNPTNAVGGSFIPSLTTRGVYFSTLDSDKPADRLNMNDPPTALVGFGSGVRVLGRSNMNEPPTALVGLFHRRSCVIGVSSSLLDAAFHTQEV
jgi:hypothetical protein